MHLRSLRSVYKICTLFSCRTTDHIRNVSNFVSISNFQILAFQILEYKFSNFLSISNSHIRHIDPPPLFNWPINLPSLTCVVLFAILHTSVSGSGQRNSTHVCPAEGDHPMCL
jgi:hypothetical protein